MVELPISSQLNLLSDHQPQLVLHWTLTLGAVSGQHTRSLTSLSLISQAKMEGHSDLYERTRSTTDMVATRGLDPPMAFGRMDPVS